MIPRYCGAAPRATPGPPAGAQADRPAIRPGTHCAIRVPRPIIACYSAASGAAERARAIADNSAIRAEARAIGFVK